MQLENWKTVFHIVIYIRAKLAKLVANARDEDEDEDETVRGGGGSEVELYLASTSQKEGSSLVHGLEGSSVVRKGS